MGQYLGRIDTDTKLALKRAEDELAALTKSKEWEAARMGFDIAGAIEPTPVMDSISLGMSVAEGDWVGAFLSGVSYIPYLGDLVAKPIKLVRATRAITAIEHRAAALAKQIAHYKNAATRIAQRKMAAAAVRARRAKEAAAKHADELKCVSCPKSGNRFGSQLPTTGTWKGEKGNSRWTSDGEPPVSVDYKEGYPDFSTSKPPSLHPAGDGKVEIEMKGNRTTDMTDARNAMRDKLGDKTWPGNSSNAPDGYTWHHNEDGTTMELVRTDVHDKALGGAPHVGGASIVKDPEF